MNQSNETVRYESRTVQKWVEAASNGTMALADLQRSFVWDTGTGTKYIKAILLGKPVGLYLILSASEQPQFQPRSFYNVKTTSKNVSELVLDGQQRLTSILHAIHGIEERRYFIKVHDLSAEDLKVETVICETKNHTTGKTAKGLDAPEKAYAANLIPFDILNKTAAKKGQLSRLANWCIEIGEKASRMDPQKGRLLEERIRDFADRCFFQREIWCCRLPSATQPFEAAEIFVDTNTSSVRIKKFDVEVAAIRGRYDKDLRSEIEAAYGKSTTFPHYFSDEPQDYIPEIGEWLLKVACLHRGEAPKEANFSNAVKYLLENQPPPAPTASHRLNSVFKDLDWALDRAARWGAPTDKMIPSWPVLHVTSALRCRMQGIKDPAKSERANQLLEAYYWRCLFSNRHMVQANDRLHKDYDGLSQMIDAGVTGSCSLTAFNDEDHPLYDKKHLLRHTAWITSSRLGKALVSVVMAADPKPTDWMTGQPMDHTHIRELQSLKKLHRHHVYPKAALEASGVEKEQINHGLNGGVVGPTHESAFVGGIRPANMLGKS